MHRVDEATCRSAGALPLFDGVMALVGSRELAGMTIEGTGELPVMRVGRTRMWLRRTGKTAD